MTLESFTRLAYRRWTDEEEAVLKEMFIEGRESGVAHKQLWKDIAESLDRKPSEVQRKLVRMYSGDDQLKSFKRLSWSREVILDRLKELYLGGKDLHKSALPQQLCFTILKVCPPSAPEHRQWFQSLDHALAEAIFSIGFKRAEDKSIDQQEPLHSFQDALDYVRVGHKRRHMWTLNEVKALLSLLHRCDYPITLAFLTNHFDLYKDVLGVNRKLESLKDVMKKFVEDGSIKSYPELVCTIAPEYIAYYNDEKTRLKLSTEEIRVKKFLDRYKIPYAIPRLGQKLPTGDINFPNVVPDFVILQDNKPVALVEVFGSIGDRENNGINDMYAEKIRVKQEFYGRLPNMKFIEIHNHGDRCDLSDSKLFELLGSFIYIR